MNFLKTELEKLVTNKYIELVGIEADDWAIIKETERLRIVITRMDKDFLDVFIQSKTDTSLPLNRSLQTLDICFEIYDVLDSGICHSVSILDLEAILSIHESKLPELLNIFAIRRKTPMTVVEKNALAEQLGRENKPYKGDD